MLYLELIIRNIVDIYLSPVMCDSMLSVCVSLNQFDYFLHG